MKYLQCSKIYLGLGGYTLPPTSINMNHRLEFSLPINAHSGKLIIAMENGPGMKMYIEHGDIPLLLLMEEIVHHLGCIKPCKLLDTLPTSTGDRRICSINNTTSHRKSRFFRGTQFQPPLALKNWLLSSNKQKRAILRVQSQLPESIFSSISHGSQVLRVMHPTFLVKVSRWFSPWKTSYTWGETPLSGRING